MQASLLTLLLLLAAIAYGRGWLRARIPTWRAVCFFLGMLCAWVAIASPVASSDETMLTGHMVQHLLLMTFAPPLIWLGEPIRAIAGRRLLWRRARQAGRVLGHPAFCWFSAAAVLVAWHVPALFRLGMESPAWHLVEHASFFGTGLLFWWPVVQPWPSVSRWPRWTMLVYLFLATLPCDVLSGFLVFSDRVAYPMYLGEHGHLGLSALQDQQCAGALMWTCVTVVFLVAGTILSAQLLSPRQSPVLEAEG